MEERRKRAKEMQARLMADMAKKQQVRTQPLWLKNFRIYKYRSIVASCDSHQPKILLVSNQLITIWPLC